MKGGVILVTIEEAGDMLDRIAEEIPREFFRDLNGGIILSPDSKIHPLAGDLYIMGTYNQDLRGLGRYIIIYYGSIQRVYGFYNHEQMRAKLREVLFHEFTHHIENLAGEHGLEIKDAQQLAKYHASKR